MSARQCDCSIIIPTRNRREVLIETLQRVSALSDCSFEIIVCDNGSTDGTLDLTERFPDVHWIALGENLGCAARNIGAVAARGWLLLMLDDDSWPEEGVISQLVQRFRTQLDLGAAALRVRLANPPHHHDAGGCPGVFFNCGGAVRRSAFLEAGGFPIDYEYYVEEYGLCCRLWRGGWRVRRQGDLVVTHARVSRNRDNDRMLRLLVRNNLRLWNRYAPPSLRQDLFDSTIERYYRVALKERALDGYNAGLREGRAVLAPRLSDASLSLRQFESLMGIDLAREEIARWADKHRAKCVGLWGRGKSAEFVIDLLKTSGIRIAAVYDEVDRPDVWRGCALRNRSQFKSADIDGLVIGSLSCGVAEDQRDALARDLPGLPILAPVCYGSSSSPPAAIPA